MTTKATICKFCGKAMPGDAGSYYHKKDCEARWCRDQLAEIEERIGEFERYIREYEFQICELKSERKRFRSRLEMALYVGD